MRPETKNFNLDTDPKLACTCGRRQCDHRAVKQSLLNRVQLVRDDALRALTVTSGGRCPFHPDEQGRTTPADHQKRVGVDIACAGGYERGQLVRLGIKHGFNAIGVGRTFVHLGYREGLPLVMWTY